MTTYTRTHDGHTMTIHAPAPGALDQAAFEAFAGGDAVLGLDVETTAIPERGPGVFGEDFAVRLVQFGTCDQAWVLNPTDRDQCQAIEGVLADPQRRFVTHTPYDVLAVWTALGIPLGQRVIDTHLISKLLDPDERAGHGLKALAARHLDDGLTQAQDALYARMRALAPAGQRAGNTWQRWGWNHIPAGDEAYVVYAGLDAIYVRRLLPLLLKECAPFAHLVRMESWLAAQATGITIRGPLLDRPYAQGLLAELQTEHYGADEAIKQALGCSGGSPRFATWLEDQTTKAGICDLPRTDTGRLQVTGDTLNALLDAHGTALSESARDLVRARLVMARTSNLITNVRNLLDFADADGRIHPQINTLRAKTARMSITNPALQTLKKHDPRLRHCLRADPGHVLISCDFSQVEIRVAAALSGDPALRKAIESGKKIHDAMAELMYGKGFTPEQYTFSKRCTFGTLYGGGARGLAKQTGVSMAVARQVVARWKRTYPRVIAYTQSLTDLPEVITASGRRIPADPARGYANGNYAIQSPARDLLLAAVYTLITRYDVGGLWLFVHDELIVQAPEADAERVRDLLQEAMTTTFRGIPIAADAEILGTHWGRLSNDSPTPAGHDAADREDHVEPPVASPSTNTPLRVLVTGSRTWTDAPRIRDQLTGILNSAQTRGQDVVIVHGACPRGADAITAAFCQAEAEQRAGLTLTEEPHPAAWDACDPDCPPTPHRVAKPSHDVDHPGDLPDYCPKAGPRRNAAMVAAGADVCLAFIHNHSPGATGTADLAEAAGIPTRRFPDEPAAVPPRPATVGPGRTVPAARRLPIPEHPNDGGLLNAALAYAARGWYVIPVQPGRKLPALHGDDACPRTGPCAGGHLTVEQRATTDPDLIHHAWNQAPFNIGIATGPSGLLVVDLDVPKPGEQVPEHWRLPGINDGTDVLAALAERHGADIEWETFMVTTCSGGTHLYYTPPPAARLSGTTGEQGNGLGWKIDTRAWGGYVVAAPSIVDGRPYQVIYDTAPAPLPDWLTILLTAPPTMGRVDPARHRAMRDLAQAGGGKATAYANAALKNEVQRVLDAEAGTRNITLVGAARRLGRLTAAGVLPRPLAEDALQAAGKSAGLTHGETLATIRSGLNYGENTARSAA